MGLPKRYLPFRLEFHILNEDYGIRRVLNLKRAIHHSGVELEDEKIIKEDEQVVFSYRIPQVRFLYAEDFLNKLDTLMTSFKDYYPTFKTEV